MHLKLSISVYYEVVSVEYEISNKLIFICGTYPLNGWISVEYWTLIEHRKTYR